MVASRGLGPVSLQRVLAVIALCLVAVLTGRLTGHLPAQISALAPALAQGSQLEISMDELVDDTWNNCVAARGGVEIRYYGEILNADEVSYDRSTGKLTANGNVSLQDVEGKVSRTDHLILNDELRDAFVAYARRQRIRIDR